MRNTGYLLAGGVVIWGDVFRTLSGTSAAFLEVSEEDKDIVSRQIAAEVEGYA